MRLVEVALCLGATGCNVAFGLDIATDARPVVVDVAVDGLSPDLAGCADGSREGYRDLALFPLIAACAGRWNIAGLANPVAGHTCLTNDDVGGCAGEDVCAEGWAICLDHTEVGGNLCPMDADIGFYATLQGSFSNANCDGNGANDVFGCYQPINTNVNAQVGMGCAPLNGTSGDGCIALGAPWVCDSGSNELNTIVKSRVDNGGVLCCKR